MKKTVVRAAWIALLVLLLSVSVAQAKAMYVKETTNLYKHYSVKSKVVMQLKAGQAVQLVATKKTWARVKVSGKVGFVQKASLAATAPGGESDAEEDEEPTGKAMYASEKLRLFKTHATSAKVLAVVPVGAQVAVKSQNGAWAKVSYGGKVGFVQKAKLTTKQPPKEDADNPAEVPSEPPAEGAVLKPGDSGEAVKKLQTRLKALEWFYGDVGGNYQTLTTQAVKDFQEAVGLPVTGIADEKTQKRVYASNAPKNVLDNNGSVASGKAVDADWWTSDIQKIFSRGKTVTVTDVETGITWQVCRSGGTNHADVQPKTAQDAALMKKAYGGAWSWNRRAIWVSVGGVKYAASMNGMPHGSDSIPDNNFDGHHCIHFTNSRTHGSNQICALHQAAIQKALRAG